MSITALEISWFAGLLEGEGTFGWHKSGKYLGSPKIAIQMTDRDIIQRAADLWGRPCNGPYGPYTTQSKPAWQTMVTGRSAIGWMMTAYCFLGERRKKKVEEVIALWKTRITIHPGREPACHPERQYFAKGLCNICYMKQYHKRGQIAHVTS